MQTTRRLLILGAATLAGASQAAQARATQTAPMKTGPLKAAGAATLSLSDLLAAGRGASASRKG